MAFVTGDLVKDTSTTTGTGALTLANASVNGFQTFGDVLANNDTCWYRIQHASADEWETGLGTYSTTGPALTRTAVLGSSNSGSAVNLSSGTKNVILTLPAVAGKPHANVKAFGAKGDGVTDDTAAIARADASGLPVVFPSGNYLVSTVSCRANTHWVGIPGASTITSTSSAANTINAGSGGTFEGLSFDGDLVHGYANTYGILFVGATSRVTNCYVTNVGRFGIVLGAVDDVVIDGCRIYKGAGHSGLPGETCVMIYGNLQLITAVSHRLSITNCYIEDDAPTDPGRGCGGIIISQYTPNPDARISVIGNRFRNIGSYEDSNYIGCVYLYYGTSQAVVANNAFEEWNYSAMNIGGSGSGVVTGNTIGTPRSGATVGAAIGLFTNFNNAGTTVTRDTLLCASNVINGGQYNIFASGTIPSSIEYADNILIVGNICLSATSHAIQTQYLRNGVISNNLIKSSAADGIRLLSSDGAMHISGNLIRDCTGAAINTQNENSLVDLSVIGNTAIDCAGTFTFRLDLCKTAVALANRIKIASGSGITGLRMVSNVDEQHCRGNAVTVTSGTEYSLGAPTTGGAGKNYRDVAKRLIGSATYNPASLADGAGATTTVTVTGAALGDIATASFSLDLQGIGMTAYVSAADTVSVRFQNETGGTIDLASGTISVLVSDLT